MSAKYFHVVKEDAYTDGMAFKSPRCEICGQDFTLLWKVYRINCHITDYPSAYIDPGFGPRVCSEECVEMYLLKES